METNDKNPILLFAKWFREATESDIPDPEVMSLATAGRDGSPSVRIVLLKEFDERGFAFYTNYRSRKALQLEENPRAAMVIHWSPLGRQVRIEGRVEKITAEESDRYFSSRPRGSQLGAWASNQSSVIPTRQSLEKGLAERENEFRNREVPRPPHWGGYRLIPDRIEFWVDREDRLHDRIEFQRPGSPDPGTAENPGKGIGRTSGEDNWTVRRLAP